MVCWWGSVLRIMPLVRAAGGAVRRDHWSSCYLTDFLVFSAGVVVCEHARCNGAHLSTLRLSWVLRALGLRACHCNLPLLQPCFGVCTTLPWGRGLGGCGPGPSQLCAGTSPTATPAHGAMQRENVEFTATTALLTWRRRRRRAQWCEQRCGIYRDDNLADLVAAAGTMVRTALRALPRRRPVGLGGGGGHPGLVRTASSSSTCCTRCLGLCRCSDLWPSGLGILRLAVAFWACGIMEPSR